MVTVKVGVNVKATTKARREEGVIISQMLTCSAANRRCFEHCICNSTVANGMGLALRSGRDCTSVTNAPNKGVRSQGEGSPMLKRERERERERERRGVTNAISTVPDQIHSFSLTQSMPIVTSLSTAISLRSFLTWVLQAHLVNGEA